MWTDSPKKVYIEYAGPNGYGQEDNFYWSKETFQIFARFLAAKGTPQGFGRWLKACFDFEEGRSIVRRTQKGYQKITKTGTINTEESGSDTSGTTENEGS